MQTNITTREPIQKKYVTGNFSKNNKQVEEVKKRMKREIVLLFIALLLSVPLASAVQRPHGTNVPNTVEETTTVLCVIGNERIRKQMSLTMMQDLIDMGAAHKEDFLTIYDKTASTEEVTVAFENLKPFFQVLIKNGLTDKTVDELNALYYDIREKIGQPRQQSAWNGQISPLGIWNGMPTPVWANVLCGQFDAGMCVGFAGGTHLIIPTVGADLFMTYGFQGTSVSVGGFGYTIAATGFNFVLGFVGILLATPLIMLGPYFLAGMSGMLVGIGV